MLACACPRVGLMGVFHGSERRSRGVGWGGVVAHGCYRRYRGGARSPPKSAWAIRLLRAGALVVAVVLRGRRRARHAAAAAMRRPALFVRGARPVAAIREGFPGILPAAVAAAQPQHRLIHARSDAGATPDFQRVGPARHLLGAEPERLFRKRAQGARGGENPRRLYRAERGADGYAR